MNKNLPDKWIRKAVFDLVDGITVDGNIINCFDTRVTGNVKPEHYIIMSTQSNEVLDVNKCEKQWQSYILIDVVTTYLAPGNTGSRLLADNIMDEVRSLTDTLNIDAASGMYVHKLVQSFPNDITNTTSNQNIFRKLMRIELVIN